MKGRSFSVKTTATLMAILFLASIVAIATPTNAQSILHVDDDGVQWPGAYTTITAAISAASPWDTIIVHTGTYAGFKAYKTGLTVEAAAGETPVISLTMATGSPWGGQVVGVLVTADDVTIEGFKITGQYSTGIWVASGADRVQILENTVDQTGFDPAALTGVTWDGSAIQSHGDDTVISKNIVMFGPSSRPHNGINVFLNSYSIVKNTVTIFEGPKYQVGINVRGTAAVAHNTVICPDKTVGTWTKVFGIWLYYAGSPSSVEAAVQHNQVSKTDYAVWVSGPSADDSVIMGNTLDTNGFGVILEGADYTNIHHNTVTRTWYSWSILLDSSSDYNLVHHNVLDKGVGDFGTGNKVFKN